MIIFHNDYNEILSIKNKVSVVVVVGVTNFQWVILYLWFIWHNLIINNRVNPFFGLKIKYLKINMLENGSKKGFLLVKIDFAFLPTTFIVYRFLVHCRVGSLESSRCRRLGRLHVHCRVGSLENPNASQLVVVGVHCRVGSLEKAVN